MHVEQRREEDPVGQIVRRTTWNPDHRWNQPGEDDQ
jgi:hypothetical protein